MARCILLHKNYLAEFVIFVTVFYSYFKTIQKGIPGGDAGELVSEACLYGTAHPPGYPLFTMITNVAMRVLPYKPAVSANIASALFGAFAAYFLYKGIFLFCRHIFYKSTKLSEIGLEIYVSAAFGSYSFAFSNLTWLYSIGAEVFALNNMLTAWVLYLSILYKVQQSDNNRYSSATASYAAFICGLSLANQHTAIFYVIIIAFVVAYDVVFRPGYCSAPLKDDNKTSVTCWRITEVLKLSIFALFGLSPYLYLPWAAMTPTKGSWGDISTLSGFFTHIFRAEYGTFSLSPANFQSEGLVERLQYYIKDAILQFHLLESVLILIGILACIYLVFRSSDDDRQLSLLVLLMFSSYIVTFHALSNLPLSEAMPFEVHRRFWMQPNLILCAWVGIGVSAILNLVKKKISTGSNNAYNSKVEVFMCCFYFALMSLKGRNWYEQHELMQNEYGQGPLGNYFESHGRAILDTIPKNSLLLSFTDLNWNSIRYLQACEKKRLDVTHLNFQIMPFPWFEKTQIKLYKEDGVIFPKVDHKSASMKKGSKGHAKILTEFFLANLNDESNRKRKIFVDLHAIGFDQFEATQNLFQGVHYIPYGTIWQVTKYNSFKYNKWTKRSSRSMETVDKLLLPLPTKTNVLAGSWEEGCAATYLDSLYQTAIFQLEIAIKMNVQNSGDAAKLNRGDSKRFFHALLQSFEHLQRILNLIEKTSHNLKLADVYKNAALSASRMTTAMTWIDKVDASVLPYDLKTGKFKQYPHYNMPELNSIILRARNTMQLYLKHSRGDPDAPVFKNHLNILNSIINGKNVAGGDSTDKESGINRGETGGQTKKKKKKKRKKKKRSSKNKDNNKHKVDL